MLDCATCREAVSARLDGEATGDPAAAVQAHLDRCAACEAFRVHAAALHRRTRVTPAADVPDLTVPILLAVGDLPPRPATQRRGALRALAVLVAVAQLVVGVSTLLGGAHAGRDLAVFELALAAGFLFAAWKPQRALSLVPLVGALAVLELVVAVVNVVGATATVTGELGHLVPVLGVGVLALLGGAEPRPVRGRARVESR